MTETSRQRSERHPLQSDQGATTIQDPVVTSIAAIAAQEVDGAHLSHGGARYRVRCPRPSLEQVPRMPSKRRSACLWFDRVDAIP